MVALSINAHPDDAEAWNAGVLKLLKDKGYEIVTATLTGGDLGGCNMTMEETARVRYEEAKVLDAEYHSLGGIEPRRINGATAAFAVAPLICTTLSTFTFAPVVMKVAIRAVMSVLYGTPIEIVVSVMTRWVRCCRQHL
ncbi:MAG: PIG-L family deacetylase [Spirochaetales bacterium]|nr:PIG-L family deacetylase [Spirochaetales bacterium]